MILITRCEVVVVIICFFTNLLVFRDFFSDIHAVNLDTKQSHTYDLVVGILSARSNFNLRQSLRKTWVGFIKDNPAIAQKILVQFVVSDQACMLPPEYRTNPYQCKEKLTKDVVLDKELISYTTPVFQSKFFLPGPVGRDFSVLYPIIVTSLGVAEGSLGDGTIVRLYDKSTEREIVNATFTVDEPGMYLNGSWFKTVPNYLLPEGFQGSIVSENFNTVTPTCSDPETYIKIEDGGGLIFTHQVKRFGIEPGKFPEYQETIYHKRCPYTTATFTYKGRHDDIKSSVPSDEEKTARLKEWEYVKNIESRQLLKESKLYSDILFVQNVDVYRNLPSQLLHFYQWVSRNVKFSFILKTDDDCFVDIERILEAIKEHDLKAMTKVWWSRFRTEWLVDRYGKWAEPDYPDVTYPTFACGAGYVLSADLVHWLARNADSLKRYQGEDVSMGIWLSAVGPNILMDHRWSCFQECSQGVFTSPEQDTESLLDMWENFQSCDNPCSC